MKEKSKGDEDLEMKILKDQSAHTTYCQSSGHSILPLALYIYIYIYNMYVYIFWQSSASGALSTLVTSVVLYSLTRATLMSPGKGETRVCGYIYIYILLFTRAYLRYIHSLNDEQGREVSKSQLFQLVSIFRPFSREYCECEQVFKMIKT